MFSLKRKFLRRKFSLLLSVLLLSGMAVTAQGASTTTVGLWTDQADFESNARTVGTSTTRVNIDTASDPGSVRIAVSTDFATTATITCLTPNRVYTTGADRSSVAVLDSATRQLVATIPVPGKVAGVVFNSSNNKVYVGQSGGNSVTVIDNGAAVPSVLRTFTTSGSTGATSAFAATYNPDQNKVYIADVAGQKVEIYDGATDVLLGVVPVIAGATTATYDAAHQKVYFTNKANSFVTVIDGVANTVESVQVADVLNLLGGKVGLRADVAATVADADNMRLSWDYDCEDDNQSIELQVRTATDLLSLDNASYKGPNDSTESWYKTVCSGATSTTQRASIDLPYAPMVELQVKLASDGMSTPVLREVRLDSQLFPNLTVADVTVTPSIATMGDAVTITGTIRNAGRGDAETSVADIALTGAGYSGQLATIATPALAAGQSHNFTATVTIPDTVSAGNYNVILCADAGNLIGETAENDNCRSTALDVTLPDFVTTITAQAGATVGETIPVLYTVTNSGWITAGSAQHTLSVVKGETRQELTSMTTAPLASGAAQSGSYSWSLQGVEPGEYQLVFCADTANGVRETNEENNCFSRTISVTYPDLAVTAVTGPAEATVGSSISVSTTVASLKGAVAASTLKLFLTRGTTPDIQIGGRDVPPLAAGATDTASSTATLPSTGISSGAYNLMACVDYPNQISESNEENNCHIGGSIFIYSSGPDLVVTNMVLPETAATGKSFSILVTVKNQGAATAASSYMFLHYSADPTFATKGNLDGGRLSSLVKGAEQTIGVTVTFPHIVQGPYYIQAAADHFRDVIESDENNNILIRGTIALTYGPDLVITEFYPPANAATGQLTPISLTVKNQGIGVSAAGNNPHHVSFYYSADPTFATKSTLSTTGNTQLYPLAPGAQQTVTVTAKWPYINSGTYYVMAIADGGNSVREFDESNNTVKSDPIPVTLGPDLVITSFAPPASVTTGQQVTIPVIVKNQGIGVSAAANNPHHVSVYYSTDPTFATKQILATGSLSPLSPGAEQGMGISTTWPYINSGTYYLIAIADSGNSVKESDESNNNAQSDAIQVTYGPDLAVTSLVTPATVATGEQITIPVIVKNLGTGISAPGNNPHHVSFYYSADPTFATKSILTTSGVTQLYPLAPGAQQTVTVTVTWPFINSGTYYVIAIADSGNSVKESDESNNSAQNAIQVTVGPDLVITSFTPPANVATGQQISIPLVVKNQGTGVTATGYNTHTVSVYYSADPTFAIKSTLGSSQLTPVAPGAERGVTIGATWPFIDSGTYYLLATVDSGNSAKESDESNNNAQSDAIQVTYGPDLVITSFAPPTNVTAGQQGTVAMVVKNQGTGVTATGNNTHGVRLYYSADPTFATKSSLYTTGNPQIGALTPGAQQTMSIAVTWPTVNSGTYYILAELDSSNYLKESDETNNTASAPITLTR